jgi:hypothetical protein
MVARYTRLPADFVDRLRDLLCTVHSEQIMMRPDGDDDRLARIVRLAVAQTKAERGMLVLVNEDRGDLQVAAAVGNGVEPLVGAFIARTGMSGFAIDDGNPVAIADAKGGPAAPPDDIDERIGGVTNSLLAVPLIIHGRSSGALELRNAPGAKGFGPDDVSLATELAYLAAAAVEEYRGDRFLFGLFANALPAALDPERGHEGDSLAAELAKWIAELRQTPAWTQQTELVSLARALCQSGDDAVEVATAILEALVERERKRRAVMDM